VQTGKLSPYITNHSTQVATPGPRSTQPSIASSHAARFSIYLPSCPVKLSKIRQSCIARFIDSGHWT